MRFVYRCYYTNRSPSPARVPHIHTLLCLHTFKVPVSGKGRPSAEKPSGVEHGSTEFARALSEMITPLERTRSGGDAGEKDWEFPRSKVTLGEQIGDGQFGVVNAGITHFSHRIYSYSLQHAWWTSALGTLSAPRPPA